MSQTQTARITQETTGNREISYSQGSNSAAQLQITQAIKIEPIVRRSMTLKSIDTILEDFDPKERHLGTKSIRIPEIQRHASWSLLKKQKLIDSVLKNLAFGLITAALQTDSNGPYTEILDGQTRLTTLHEFKTGKFRMSNGNYYRDLSQEEKTNFNNCQVCWEEIRRTPDMTKEEFDKICCDMFERLNSGKQLTSNEMFHSRFQSPVMQFVLSLKNHERYGQKIKKYICGDLCGGQKFTGLSEFAGIVLASITKQTDCITKSYAVNGPLVGMSVTQTDKNETYRFLDWFFGILERVIPNPRTNVQKSFIKLSETTGMMLFDWITNPNDTHDDMWNAFIKEYHRNPKKIIQSLFETVTESEQRNSYGMCSKLTACINAFTPTGSFEHIVMSNDDGTDTDTEEEN